MIAFPKRRMCLTLSLFLTAAVGHVHANSGPSAREPVQVVEAGAVDMYGGPRSSGVATYAAPTRFADWFYVGFEGEPSMEPALVIPDKEIDVATTSRIMEDLGIMSRIIEKNVLASYGIDRGGWREPVMGGFASPDAVGPRALFSSVGRARPLYIGGYGATFFIQVDFPLLSPTQTPEKPAETQEDPVWAQTRRSLLEPRPGATGLRGEAAGRPYNQGKVDSFRRSLIATMKHAANIRDLESIQSVTFVVQGLGSPASVPQRSQPGVVIPTVGNAPSFDRSVMTLRTTKADVDACAKGQLTREQFEQRVQVTAY